MNKNVLIGMVAGIGIAVAGGVAGFTLMNSASDSQEQITADAAEQNIAVAGSEPAQVFAEECWDEEIEVQAEVRDDKAIAGTAAGALIGGALADRIGDDDDLVTAAGAAAGAFLGRRAQREYQDNRTTTTTVRRCAQVQQ